MQHLIETLSGAFQARNRPGLCTKGVLLRSLERGPVPANELWRRGRVSKRAMKSIVKAATKRELVGVDDGEVRLLASLEPIEPAACPPLEALVSRLELEHPHFPVPYGTADPTIPAHCLDGSGVRRPRQRRYSTAGRRLEGAEVEHLLPHGAARAGLGRWPAPVYS